MTYVTPAPPPPSPRTFLAVTLSHAGMRWGVGRGGGGGGHVYLSSAALGGAASGEAAAAHPGFLTASSVCRD